MTANGSVRFGDDYDRLVNKIELAADRDRTEEEKQLLDMLNKISGVTPENSSDPENLYPLLDPQETTSRNISDSTYRGRFLAGKEEEMDSAIETYVEIYKSPSNGHVQALRDCRKYAQFVREKTSGEVMVRSDACHDRWCPMCAGQKFHYAKDATVEFLLTLESPRFLTLTLRNCESDLKTQVEFLQKSFRTLRQRAFWKKNVRGGMWYLEIKRGLNSGLWHPHLHILLDGNFMEQARLSELWEQVTFGSPILYIVEINDIERAAKYVAKYSAKPAKLSGMPLHDRIEVVEAMFRKRMCGTFGSAKEFTLTPPKQEMVGEWQPIGWHDKVVKDAATDPKARAVLTAYHNELTLTEEDYEAYSGNKVHFVCPEPPVKLFKQIDFDFFKGKTHKTYYVNGVTGS